MDRSNLQRQVTQMRRSLIEQEHIDEQQFVQLEDLQDDSNPNFVEEIVTLFYQDSTRLFHSIEDTLSTRPVDFTKLESYIHQFRGSTSSIGAIKVKKECTQLKDYCLEGDLDGCLMAFQNVKQEHETLRIQLETYFQLRRQAGLAGSG